MIGYIIMTPLSELFIWFGILAIMGTMVDLMESLCADSNYLFGIFLLILGVSPCIKENVGRYMFK